MSCKHILSITLLDEPELFFFFFWHTVLIIGHILNANILDHINDIVSKIFSLYN